MLSRRHLLIATVAGAATSLVSITGCRAESPGPCRKTPPQTEGPFYPVDNQLDEDNDLTYVSGREGRAEGAVIYVVGKIQDAQCRPIQKVRVEIWQASAKGRYNHPRDHGNPVPLDPFFQGWGEALTDRDGRYLFKTVHPGQYPAAPGWIRPSHIHFKVSGPGVRELTSQMYFAGDPYLEQDRIFLDVPSDERASVVVNQKAPGPEFAPDAVVYRFDLTLRSAI